MVVDCGAETNELYVLVLVQDGGEDVRDKINSLLQRPTADEDEELGLFWGSASITGR